MSQPGLTAPSSTGPAPDILHTFFLCCFPALLSPQQCHTVAALLPSCCLPSKGVAHHALACPLVPCSLALGTRACGGALEQPQGDEKTLRAQQERQQQAKRPCKSFRGDSAKGQGGQMDLAGQGSAAGLSPSPIPSFLFFCLLILSRKPRSFKDVHVSLALP